SKAKSSTSSSGLIWRRSGMAGDHILDIDLNGVRQRLWIALQQLYLNDRYLMEHGIGECSITHRLAVYLEQAFSVWHVDCEFNRSGEDPKLAMRLRASKRPDIIVHRRGPDGPNLLALEVKKGKGIDSRDREKATRYVNELHYRWAVC